MSSDKKIKYAYNKNLPILKNGWKGNVLINNAFYNDAIVENPPFIDVFKWKFQKNPQKKQKEEDTFNLQSSTLESIPKATDNIIWLGHSSFLITINGITIITDPCLFDIPMIKRKVPIPCKIEVLKNIDYVLISHDHRDHFDKKSIAVLWENNPKMEVLTGLNMSNLFKKYKLNTKIQEAGWYQEYKLHEDIRILFLPAKHWGRRGLLDYNKNLWGSFLIISKHKKIYFSGDTAYSNVFKAIHKEFGKMDICMLPIGAYSPKFMMENSHTTPEEAYQIFKDLDGGMFIPMHYGTYDLSDEPLGEPIKRLEQCFQSNNKKLHRVTVGEVLKIE